MGSSYCLSTDKKSLQNDQTVNIKVSEEYIDNQKITQTSNNNFINKNIVSTDVHSNNNGKNHINNASNHSNKFKSNDLSTNLNNNNNKKKIMK